MSEAASAQGKSVLHWARVKRQANGRGARYPQHPSCRHSRRTFLNLSTTTGAAGSPHHSASPRRVHHQALVIVLRAAIEGAGTGDQIEATLLTPAEDLLDRYLIVLVGLLGAD